MTTRLPDRNDVDELRAVVAAEPPGPGRDLLEERLTALTDLVATQTPVDELPFDPTEN